MEHLAKRAFGVDRARVDRKAGTLHGEALVGFRQAEIMPNEINQIGRVFAVMNCESVAETDVERILAKKPRADGMKRSRPIERMCHWPGLRAEHLCRDALDPTLHFGGGAAREGEQHYPTRVCTRG